MRSLLALALGLSLCAACGKSSNETPDAGSDAGPDFADGGCYTNPTTSYEIINACTDAGYVDKSPTLPLLLPDGGLPPLP